jgi:hypothetical protein
MFASMETFFLISVFPATHYLFVIALLLFYSNYHFLEKEKKRKKNNKGLQSTHQWIINEHINQQKTNY